MTEKTYTKIGEAEVTTGEATINYNINNNMEAGDYEIKAVYIQNDEYKTSEDTATLEIRHPLTITIPRIATSLGENVTLEAIIQSNGSNIPNKTGKILFKINNTPVNPNALADINGGTATYIVDTIDSPLVEIGANTITAEYIKDETYENKIGTGEIYIADDLVLSIQDVVTSKNTSINVPLTVPVIDADKRDDLVITVSLKNGANIIETKTISNEQNADYTLDNLVESTTNIAFTGIVTAGNYTIDVSTVKTDEFNAVHLTGTLTIKQDVLINLVQPNQSTNPGDTVTLGAIITDENGGTVTQGQISVTYPDNTTQLLPVGSSNPNSTTFQVPQNTQEGSDLSYIMQYIAGNAPYEDSTSVTGGIHVRVGTILTLTGGVTVTGGVYGLNATVTDTNDAPVREGDVEFSIENGGA